MISFWSRFKEQSFCSDGREFVSFEDYFTFSLEELQKFKRV